eukprot:1370137-Amphidinium_carterae.1
MHRVQVTKEPRHSPDEFASRIHLSCWVPVGCPVSRVADDMMCALMVQRVFLLHNFFTTEEADAILDTTTCESKSLPSLLSEHKC